MDIKGGFYFIATPLDVQVNLPIQITPSLRLEKPNESQLADIKTTLQKLSPIVLHNISGNYYEVDWSTQKASDACTLFSSKGLSKDEWKYYILSYAGNNLEVHKFLDISCIIHPYISSLMHWHTAEEYGIGEIKGFGLDGFGASTYWRTVGISESNILGHISLEKLRNTMDAYQDLDPTKHVGILRAVSYYRNLSRFGNTGELPFLGLFATIEMLLTHDPKYGSDSLSHQIRTKISLLESRMTDKFDYSVFNNAPHNKIWNALYHYRSNIAHGEISDFSDKELRLLKDSEAAFKFLRSATCALLVHAIQEPDLVNGLKPI